MKHELSRRHFLKTAALAGGAAALTAPFAAWAAKENQQGWQIGCYTRPWDQYEYRVALDGIAEAGYKYAGIMTGKGKTWITIAVDSTPEEVSTIAEDVKKRGLKTISLYGGDFPVAKSIDAGIAGLKK